MTPVEDTGFNRKVVGHEKRNERAADLIRKMICDDESLIAVSGFDRRRNVIAISDQRVLIAAEKEGIILHVSHGEIDRVIREGRTLVIRTKKGEEHRHRFGSDQTVKELVERVNSPQTYLEQADTGERTSIAGKVQFWEEQEKINQALIPRVLRQNELLTEHIADHENLPEVAGNAISQALAGAREEQRRQYEAALNASKEEQARRYESALNAAKERLGQQYEAALNAAKEQQKQQHQADLNAAREQLSEQTQESLNQALATMSEESRKPRNLVVAISTGAVAIAIAALILGILA